MMEKLLSSVGSLLYGMRFTMLFFYVGLVAIIFGILGKFLLETYKLINTLLFGSLEKIDLIIKVLELVDMTMVAQLVWVVALAGVSLFVTTGHFDKTEIKKPDWLDHVNTYNLKLKLAFAIISISGVHALKTYLSGDLSLESIQIVTMVAIIHFTFVLSAIGISFAERLTRERWVGALFMAGLKILARGGEKDFELHIVEVWSLFEAVAPAVATELYEKGFELKLAGSVAIASGILALVVFLLPFSEFNDYQYFVGVMHLGPAMKILYLLPFSALIVGLLTFTGKLDKPGPWLLVTGVIGMILVGLGTVASIDQLELIVPKSVTEEGSKVSIALGAQVALLAYALLVVGPLMLGRLRRRNVESQ